jgi:hypothetical protein
MPWITLSLALNVLVLVPVTIGLVRDGVGMRDVFGPRTPARGILLSIYLAILFGSIGLLILGDPKRASVLLALQVVYKLTTPITVGSPKNPVVLSNLGIAAFHVFTLLQS